MRLAEEDGLKSLLKAMVRDSTTSPEKGLDKSVVVNLLNEVAESIGGSESMDALRANLEAMTKTREPALRVRRPRSGS